MIGPWQRARRLVRVHINEQPFSIEGVLIATDRLHYRLANASHLETAGRSHALDGEAWVPREKVLYLQVLG